MAIVRRILDAQYRLVRAPATLVERQVLDRLPAESLLRMSVEGGLGAVDAVAGRIIRNDEARRRGRALMGEVKASLLARWDDRRAALLRDRAESQRSRSYARARRTEDLAHHEAVRTIDCTLTETVDEKAAMFRSAADRAATRASTARDSADRRRQVAEQNRKLEQRQGPPTDLDGP